MKWGNRYNYQYVNRLYKSILRHTRNKTRLICFTDNKSKIDKEVLCLPLPNIKIPNQISFTPWRKLSVWQFPLHDLKGDVLFLDLDLVITGNLDKFFNYKKGKYCVIENWTQLGKKIGNTSCFRFPVGKYISIFEISLNFIETFSSLAQPNFFAVNSIKLLTLCILPVAMTKSSGCSC